MSIQPPSYTKQTLDNLDLLSKELQQAQKGKKAIFLKVVGDENGRHVEVVRGLFWNFIATIANLFKAESYDLHEITRVLYDQLHQLQTVLPGNKKTGMRVSKLFVRQFYPKNLLKNRTVDAHFKENFVWRLRQLRKEELSEMNLDDITELFKEIAFELPKQEEESGFTKLATAYTSFINIYKGPVSVKVEPTSINEVIQSVNEIVKKEESRSNQMRHDLDATKSSTMFKENFQGEVGSLADGVTDFIRKSLRLLPKPLPQNARPEQIHDCLERLRSYESAVQEASAITVTYSQNDQTIAERLQSKRALLLLCLRALVRKADITVLMPHDSNPKYTAMRETLIPDLYKKLEGESSFIDDQQRFSRERLASISEAELEDLREEIEKALLPLEPIWNTVVAFQGRSAQPLTQLLQEFNRYFSDLKPLQEAIQEAVTKKVQPSKQEPRLAQQTKERLLKNLTTESGLYEAAAATSSEASMRLFQLRELLFTAEKHLQEKIGKAEGKAEKRVFQAIENKIGQLWKELAGSKGFLDPDKRIFHPDRLRFCTMDELKRVKAVVLDNLEPLHGSDKLSDGLRWKDLSNYRRELRTALHTRS